MFVGFVLAALQVLCLGEVAFLKTVNKDFINIIVILWKVDFSQIMLSVISLMNILL